MTNISFEQVTEIQFFEFIDKHQPLSEFKSKNDIFYIDNEKVMAFYNIQNDLPNRYFIRI
jgi:hypothetical protein